ncbi:hypothetical protein ACULMA_14120 [Xanthomonas arboricola pv. corylina]|uniref:hypothetical protein n=1 Tax=Xanthomonas arboricola TaxID=56448 RepID=UPI004040A08D
MVVLRDRPHLSMAMLSVESTIVLKLSAKVAASVRVTMDINSFLLSDSKGLTSQAMLQGGVWMLLTVVIITMSTVAVALWQGSMSSFMHFSAFSGCGASSPGPQGQPAGSYTSARRDADARSTPEAKPANIDNSRASVFRWTIRPQMSGTRGLANDGNRIARFRAFGEL